jgi:large subunit ribosomal protein L1
MAKNRSKRYDEAAKLVEEGKHYSWGEAMDVLKKFPAPKFDQTVTLSIHLGVDPKQSDQMVRGTCPLPHGSGKDVRVLMVAKVKEGFSDFDVAVATPDAMSEVRKLGRFLGPRGLMPNPKTGTVTDDTASAVKAVKAGRVDFKLDKGGNVAVPVGKVSFDPKSLVENSEAAIESVVRAKPASAKGVYIQRVTVTATMSPGIALDVSPYAKN